MWALSPVGGVCNVMQLFFAMRKYQRVSFFYGEKTCLGSQFQKLQSWCPLPEASVVRQNIVAGNMHQREAVYLIEVKRERRGQGKDKGQDRVAKNTSPFN